MSRVSIKGLLIGGITDLVLSSIFGIPLVVIAIATHRVRHVPREQLSAAITAAIHGSTPLHLAQLLIGGTCSVLGGYVAGRIAKHDHVLNGVLSATPCMAVGIYSIARGKSPESLIVQLLLLVVATPLAGALGGYLSSLRKSRAISAA